MGTRFEIWTFQPEKGRRNGEYGDYGWDQIWGGSSRLRALCAFLIALAARQGRPLKLVWR